MANYVIEVDNDHKGLVASWFGVSKTELKDQSSKTQQEDVNEKSKNETFLTCGDDNDFIEETREQRLSKADITTFVGEKIKKKLHKNKRRHEEITKEEADNVKGIKKKKNKVKSKNDSDDESRTMAVTKPKVKKVECVRPELMSTDARLKYLEQKISDPTTSKNTRKRLRKKLTRLSQNENKSGKNDESPSICKDKELNVSLDKKDETHSESEEELNDTSAIDEIEPSPQTILTPDGADGTTSKEIGDEPNQDGSREKTSGRRKRKKKRSKQKNIRKDNRPAHLKPGYVPPHKES